MIYVYLALAAPLAVTSDIRSDEHAVFFPTPAHQDAKSGNWTVPIHGVIFEPEESSLKRRALISIIRRAIKLEKKSEESELFRQRIRPFLVDNERGKKIVVRLGDKTVQLPKSGANGHFHGTIELSDKAARGAVDKHGWATYRAVMKPGDTRTFAGRVQFIKPRGVSVITDIDDTIKISHVTDKKELMKYTFLRPFEAVPGMADMYQTWAKDDAAFHYLSASPWQLYGPLAEFTDSCKFPAGTFTLRNFRLKDSSAMSLFAASAEYKQDAIDRLLARYPERQFVLVGDSGQLDPEIYAATARKYGKQIRLILIRNVTDSDRNDERFKEAMKGLPATMWMLFDKPSEISKRRIESGDATPGQEPPTTKPRPSVAE